MTLWKQQKEDVQVKQSGLNFLKRSATAVAEVHTAFIAKVRDTHADRMTCDIETLDGGLIHNVPVLAKGGVIDDEPYGELDLPDPKDYVIVMFGGYGQRHKVVVGTVLPYLTNVFTKDAVNSSGKQFTTKILEAGKEKHYRRVFKSGASVEVEEDGTMIVETPSGLYIKLDESTGDIMFEDGNGNDIMMTTGKVTINGNFEVLQ